MFYDAKGIVPFASPFILTYQGKVNQIEANKKNKQSISLYRKYYIGTHCYNVAHRLLGGKFQAANKEDFSDAVTLYQVVNFTVQSHKISLDTLKNAYQYWRYYSGEEQYCNIAEIYFYKKDSSEALYGQIIGEKDSTNINTEKYGKGAVFDQDPLTFFDASTPSDSWVGMDFGELVEIKYIWYTPRSDGNDITPGDTRELFYWSENKWFSLVKQIAKEPLLMYENVPVNALLWIRNLSRGQEERIFTYNKGKQIWW